MTSWLLFGEQTVQYWCSRKIVGDVGPDASGLGGQWEHVLDWTGNASQHLLPLIYLLLLLLP